MTRQATGRDAGFTLVEMLIATFIMIAVTGATFALMNPAQGMFAAQPEAMSQGLTASAFSFNSGSGRCERCCGTGFEKVEMQFLSDLYVRCAECEGKRFQPHVLKVTVQDKSIQDVLELTVSEAIQFFAQIGEEKTLSSRLDVLDEALSVFKDDLQSDLYIGWAKGFLDVERVRLEGAIKDGKHSSGRAVHRRCAAGSGGQPLEDRQ